MIDHAATDELERNLSEVARALFVTGTVEGSLRLTIDLAVATIEGFDAAGVFVVHDERVTTAAASDPIVVELDELQFVTDEGPCLDAVSEGGTVYGADSPMTSAGPGSVQQRSRPASAVRWPSAWRTDRSARSTSTPTCPRRSVPPTEPRG
jgi:hypothetical protein